MSVSVAEMARQDQEQARSSKKRKYTDEERAELKKKKKQKHMPIKADVPEVEDSPTVSKKKWIKDGVQDSIQPRSAKQDRRSDMELPDVEQDFEIPATEETPTIPKKRRNRKDTATSIKIASPAHKMTEKEDVELPDTSANLDENVFALTTPFTNGISSTSQLILPSDSTEDTPFHTTRASFYVPCPAISLNTALSSLISTHLTPLLLTYYAPVSGIVLSIADVSISSLASGESGKPLQLPRSASRTSEQYAPCAHDSGVSFTWLTGTFTIFRPYLNSTLSGYINIASEGFIGLVLYNYFQVGIARSRIPKSWLWTAPGSAKASKKQPKKGRIRDSESADNDGTQGSLTTIPDNQVTLPPSQRPLASTFSTGHWTTADGTPLKESDPIQFRVVDIDTVPSNPRDSTRLGLQIEGTLLDEVEEAKLLDEERIKFERTQKKAHGRTPDSLGSDQINMTSGRLGREESVASAAVQKQKHHVAY